MLIERRSVLGLVILAVLPCAVVAAGCSDANPAAGSGDGDGTRLETVDGGPPPASSNDAGAGADADAGYNGLPCLDDTAMTTTDGGAAATACPSIPTCSAYCTRISARYKRGVAQTAIACIAKLGTCADENEARNCVDLALGRACPDPSAPGYCTPLVKACDPNAGGAGSNVSEKDCETLASALTASGRSDFGACLQSKITAGTCPDTAVQCIASIRE